MDSETTLAVHNLLEINKTLSTQIKAQHQIIAALIYLLPKSHKEGVKKYLQALRDKVAGQSELADSCRLAAELVAAVPDNPDDDPPRLHLIHNDDS